jgi:hypothetical protein
VRRTFIGECNLLRELRTVYAENPYKRGFIERVEQRTLGLLAASTEIDAASAKEPLLTPSMNSSYL